MRIEARNKMLESVTGSVASPLVPISPFSMLLAVLQRHLRWERSQTTEAQQVVGRAYEVGMQLHSGNAAKARAAQATPALHPAEDLLDPLALSLAHPVAVMTRCASVQPGGVAALDLCDVWANATPAKKTHKRLAVITLVGTEAGRLQALFGLALEQLCRRGRLGLQRRAHANVYAQPVAVLHERMSAKAQLRLFPLALARGLRFRITGGAMRIVRALAAPE